MGDLPNRLVIDDVITILDISLSEDNGQINLLKPASPSTFKDFALYKGVLR